MLFNSYEFLLLFLPGVFLTHRLLLLSGASTQLLLVWFCVTSSFFYAWWEPHYLLLLYSSLLLNFSCVQVLRQPIRTYIRKGTLAAGVMANLGLLAYFKYTGFILTNLQQTGLWHDPVPNIVLPLAISFFTFQQIAYLVTCYRDPQNSCSLLEHIFFITFFPHLIAGPIVYKNELVDQVRDGRLAAATARHWQQGLSLFIIGLSKKLLIGDNIAWLINPLYDHGGPTGSLDAWLGSILFGFQIYFDFSAYSDMALGLAYLFGLRLPINFDSPYQATHYREFWRRWHVTLFRFLRDHVYIPLRHEKHGQLAKILLTLLVFFLSGLWHGAAWTFVAWGVINGILVILNDKWLLLCDRRLLTIPDWIKTALGRSFVLIAMSLTFMLFRAPDFHTATAFLSHLFSAADITNSQLLATAKTTSWGFLLPSSDITLATALCMLCALLAWLVWCAPNAVRYSLDDYHTPSVTRMPNTKHIAIALGLLAWCSIMAIPASTSFLYFQF